RKYSSSLSWTLPGVNSANRVSAIPKRSPNVRHSHRGTIVAMAEFLVVGCASPRRRPALRFGFLRVDVATVRQRSIAFPGRAPPLRGNEPAVKSRTGASRFTGFAREEVAVVADCGGVLAVRRLGGVHLVFELDGFRVGLAHDLGRRRDFAEERG